MYNEILAMPISQKAKVLGLTRERVFSYMSGRNLATEESLQLLHKSTTVFSDKLPLEQQFLHEWFIEFFKTGDASRISPDGIRLALEEKELEKYTPDQDIARGNYRILGCFNPNPTLAVFNSEAENYFTAAVPVSTRDYLNHQFPLYYPPIFNIHKMMSAVSNTFDNRIAQATANSEVAEHATNFYFWGLVMVHPFLGGNHRAFDRFLEYTFFQKGMELKLPLNETLNIPNDHPFNKELYRQRRKLLANSGLTKPSFNPKDLNDIPKWLKYHEKLNEVIAAYMESEEILVSRAAKELVCWC